MENTMNNEVMEKAVEEVAEVVAKNPEKIFSFSTLQTAGLAGGIFGAGILTGLGIKVAIDKAKAKKAEKGDEPKEKKERKFHWPHFGKKKTDDNVVEAESVEEVTENFEEVEKK